MPKEIADKAIPLQEDLGNKVLAGILSVKNGIDADLLMQDAKVDVFGVGERLITAKSSPMFDGVYKLVPVEQADG